MIIYTDGSALGNPGKGGYGYLVWDTQADTVLEGGGYQNHATNNQMEMMALLGSLDYLNTLKEKENIEIKMDSNYVKNGISNWINNWKKNNWQTANKKPVLNKELWLKIDIAWQKANLKHKIKLSYVAGHVGIGGNEMVDQIAKSFAEHKKWDCFFGSKMHFEVLRKIKL